AYAAPERLGDPPGPADTASDQYGLGVLLYAMLTGDPPHVGDDEEVIARVLAADRAPSPRHDRKDVPRDLDAVCRKVLSPDPAGPGGADGGPRDGGARPLPGRGGAAGGAVGPPRRREGAGRGQDPADRGVEGPLGRRTRARRSPAQGDDARDEAQDRKGKGRR